jgi:hypothetical protein
MKHAVISMTDEIEPFDEASYLRRYPDIAAAVLKGGCPSGRAHYEAHGKTEGRTGAPSAFDQAFQLGGNDDIRWSEARLESLRQSVDSPGGAGFQWNCSRVELATALGDVRRAKTIFRRMLTDSWNILPQNGHYFTSIVRLALTMQATDLVNWFLDARYGKPGMFHVHFDKAAPHPSVHVVAVDQEGHCSFGISPGTIGQFHTDLYVNRLISCLPMLAAYCSQAEIKPGSALMNDGDSAPYPCISFCSNATEAFLVPDPYFTATEGYNDSKRRLASNFLPWDARKPIAFWRGGTSGQRTGDRSWQTLPRIKLCIISREQGEFIDAGISHVAQSLTPNEEQEIAECGLVRDSVPFIAFAQYKYQIDIDGNSNSWPGLFQKLLTGNPVLKVTSPHGYRQWYYHLLEPWINFVPVGSDMADLVEKIQWLKANDHVAKSIGEAGRSLAMSLDMPSELIRANRTILAAFRSAGAGKAKLITSTSPGLASHAR